MTIFLFFFIFLISMVLISSTSKGDIMGLLNSSGVIHYTLTHFNDSTTNQSLIVNLTDTTSLTHLKIPKNASILSAKFNVTGQNSIFTLLTSVSLESKSNASLGNNYLDYDGSNFFIECTSALNGDNVFNDYCVAIYNIAGTYLGQTNVSINSAHQIEGLKVNGTSVYVSDDSDSLFYKYTIATNTRTNVFNYTCNSVGGTNSGGFGLEYNGSDFYLTNPDGLTTDLCSWNFSNKTQSIINDYSTPLENAGGSDTDLFLASDNITMYVIHNNDLIYINLSSKSTKIVGTSSAQGIAGDDNYIYTTLNGISQYAREGLPSNINISVNGTPFFVFEGTFNRDNGTSDFKDYLQSELNRCSPNTKGICNILINITSSTRGKVNLYNLQINYTYNITPQIEIAQFTNKTYNFSVGSFFPILRKFRFKNLFPTTDLNITGFFVNSTTSNCFIDGVSRPVGRNAIQPYCNLTNPQYTNASGGIWTNHTLFDNTTLGTYSPVNLTNSSQLLNNSRERIRFFNVTSYYPNGSIANHSLEDIIYNITFWINLTDTDLPNKSVGYAQGIKWFNGSNFVSLNTTNNCKNPDIIAEGNYSNVTNAGLLWYGCYNDSDFDDVNDYFKILVPQLSNHQFYLFGEEDSKKPNATIIKPIGTQSSTTFTIDLNVTDDVGLDICYYNVTNSADTVTEIAKTTFACGNFTTTGTVSGDGTYILNMFSNDTSGNENITLGTFSVSVPAGGGGSSGGGGGGVSECPIGFFLNESGLCINASLYKNITLLNLTVLQLKLFPNVPDVDKYSLFTPFEKNTEEWAYLLTANKVLKNCSTTGNFECEIRSNSTILLTSLIKNEGFSFCTKLQTGTIRAIDVDNTVASKNIRTRILNFGCAIPLPNFKIGNPPFLNYLLDIKNGVLKGIMIWFFVVLSVSGFITYGIIAKNINIKNLKAKAIKSLKAKT